MTRPKSHIFLITQNNWGWGLSLRMLKYDSQLLYKPDPKTEDDCKVLQNRRVISYGQMARDEVRVTSQNHFMKDPCSKLKNTFVLKVICQRAHDRQKVD